MWELKTNDIAVTFGALTVYHTAQEGELVAPQQLYYVYRDHFSFPRPEFMSFKTTCVHLDVYMGPNGYIVNRAWRHLDLWSEGLFAGCKVLFYQTGYEWDADPEDTAAFLEFLTLPTP